MHQRILRLPQVKQLTGLSRTAIYVSAARGTFPKQIRLSARAIGFLESEVQAWILERIESSRSEMRAAS